MVVLPVAFSSHVFAQTQQPGVQPVRSSASRVGDSVTDEAKPAQFLWSRVVENPIYDTRLIRRLPPILVPCSSLAVRTSAITGVTELTGTSGMGTLITFENVEPMLYPSVNPDDWPNDGQASPPSDGEQTRSTNSIKPGAIKDNQTHPNENAAEPAPKRILGIIPNYRTSPSLKDFQPLTPKEKFTMARQDSLDRGAFIISALLAGHAQWTKATPSFGQGVPGYARYFSCSYGDYVIGNFMTEAIFPTILHQDPRYFRRGTGSIPSRFGHAVWQIFWTRNDSGRMQFNFSEIVGNSTAVAISNVYYPDNRDAQDAMSKLGIQIGIDTAGNILKEFSPELNRIFSRKHHAKDATK